MTFKDGLKANPLKSTAVPLLVLPLWL